MPKSSEVADRKKWGDASSSESKKLVRPAAPLHLSSLGLLSAGWFTDRCRRALHEPGGQEARLEEGRHRHVRPQREAVPRA